MANYGDTRGDDEKGSRYNPHPVVNRLEGQYYGMCPVLMYMSTICRVLTVLYYTYCTLPQKPHPRSRRVYDTSWVVGWRSEPWAFVWSGMFGGLAQSVIIISVRP